MKFGVQDSKWIDSNLSAFPLIPKQFVSYFLVKKLGLFFYKIF